MRYEVSYTDKSDDLCHVWVEADCPADAEQEVRHEYWDVKRILDVYPL